MAGGRPRCPRRGGGQERGSSGNAEDEGESDEHETQSTPPDCRARGRAEFTPCGHGPALQVSEDVQGHHREPDREAGLVRGQEQPRVSWFDREQSDAGPEQRKDWTR